MKKVKDGEHRVDEVAAFATSILVRCINDPPPDYKYVLTIPETDNQKGMRIAISKPDAIKLDALMRRRVRNRKTDKMTFLLEKDGFIRISVKR